MTNTSPTTALNIDLFIVEQMQRLGTAGCEDIHCGISSYRYYNPGDGVSVTHKLSVGRPIKMELEGSDLSALVDTYLRALAASTIQEPRTYKPALPAPVAPEPIAQPEENYYEKYISADPDYLADLDDQVPF